MLQAKEGALLMDDLLADFIAETREMLEASGGELVAWEADPADRARLDTIFRFVHTVKGNCGFFDFPRLASLSHAAEDALADCRADDDSARGSAGSGKLSEFGGGRCSPRRLAGAAASVLCVA